MELCVSIPRFFFFVDFSSIIIFSITNIIMSYSVVISIINQFDNVKQTTLREILDFKNNNSVPKNRLISKRV